MNKVWKVVIAATLVVAVFAAIKMIVVANRPLVEAPKGTAPLDNKLDTAGVAHLVVDEAGVLPEETEQIILIYNANWSQLEDRVMAVVTVESTKNAEEDAWQWAERLSLGRNDALLLFESNGGRSGALVSGGTFREDIDTLNYGYLERLTYMPLRAGDFDVAVLNVFERMHYLYGYDGEQHRRAEVREGVIALSVLAVLILPILLHMIGEKIDGPRFKRWYNAYGISDVPTVPWKTVFFWHRVGSKWYNARISGEWIDYSSIIRKQRREKGVRTMMRGGRMR